MKADKQKERAVSLARQVARKNGTARVVWFDGSECRWLSSPDWLAEEVLTDFEWQTAVVVDSCGGVAL